MKRPLLLVTLSLIFGASPGIAKSELETLRALCAEQDRQIRQLEDDNAKLRSMNEVAVKQNRDRASATDAASRSGEVPAGGAVSERAVASRERSTGKADAKPAPASVGSEMKSSSTADKKKGANHEDTSPSAATPAAKSASGSTGTGKTYQVKQGETFYSIAKKFGTTSERLMAANPDIKPSLLRPGLTLKLGKSAAASSAAPVAAPKKPTAPPAPLDQPGSTPVLAHKATNTASLPAASVASKGAVAPEGAKKSTLAAASGAMPAAAPKVRSVTIDRTTTYGEFAAKHGTTIARLNQLNALDLIETTVLAKGSELYIIAQP
jgi:LysM repeat protein